MARRFTLAGLLLFTTFACLVLAFIVPRWRYSRRHSSRAHNVSVAASADGSTFAALIGDGRLFVWDSTGNLTSTGRSKHFDDRARSGYRWPPG